jgi:LysW-gamma-L-lysine carboxypeptidase
MSASIAAETLTGLLTHYSPTGQEGIAVEFLVEHMHHLGYTQAFADEAGNAVGILGEGPRQVILLGHIDTVPGKIPFNQVGDRLYGRGAVDAKGPLAAFVDAVKATGVRGGWQFIVIGAVDEEQDSSGARFIAKRYRPSFAIIGEPSHWERITLAYMGNASARIYIRRPQVHRASGQESACEAIFHAWQKIKTWTLAYNQPHRRAFECIHPSLNSFSSGRDGFEEWANAQVEVRLPVAFPPENWYEQLKQIIQTTKPGLTIIQPSGFPVPAHKCSKNTPLVRAFLAGIRSTGGKPTFVLKTGTADLNIVAPIWGCPTLAYGPGDSTLDHTAQEHISLIEYARSVRVLQTVLERLSAD